MDAPISTSTETRPAQSINPYSYIGDNPLSGIDPTGYMPLSFTGPFVFVSGDNGANSHDDKASLDRTASPAQVGADTSAARSFLAGEILGTVGVFVPGVKEAISDIQNPDFQEGVAAGELATGAALVGVGVEMTGGGGALMAASDGTAALTGAGALATEGIATVGVDVCCDQARYGYALPGNGDAKRW